jgi:hypothetical protein
MAWRPQGSREDDSWFSQEQLAKVTPADEAEVLRSPVPTRMVSNGEYMPHPQTDKQRRVEHRIKELARSVSRDLGISRRQFLSGTGGMAACFLAMNEVFGVPFFKVRPTPASEPSPRGVYRPVPADYASRVPDELKRIMEFPGFASDNISKMKSLYAEAGGQRSNTRYGWIRTRR